MSILQSLKFCMGSVAKKDLVPALTHFAIKDSKVRGYNGVLALCSPIDFDIECKPRADTLIKAITNCHDVVQLSLTPAGRLSIKSGVFKVFVDCIQGDTPHVEPQGEIVHFDGEALLKGIKAVAPFIGTDATRVWSQGILIKDQSLFATNNIILVQYWLGVDFPHIINIPRAAIKEMLRINEAPLFAQVAEDSITFHYDEDRWLRTQLYVTEWPDLGRILNNASTQLPIDIEIFKGLEVLKPFVDKLGTILIDDGRMTTHADDNEGAAYEIASLVHEGCYNNEMLALLEGSIETIDWSTYPKPCLFQGGRLRGAIIGMRKS